jgi:hypothetical protein
MTLQTINLGTYANDGTGDDLRTAFTKVNANFALLNTEAGVNNAANVGTGTGLFKDKTDTFALEFKTLTSTDNSVTITSTATTVDLASNASVAKDPAPQLGGNLNLNGYHIYNGDSQTTVYGIDTRIINNLLGILLATQKLTVDLGSFVNPTGIHKDGSGNVISDDTKGYSWDFGSFTAPVANICNFGSFV